MTKRHFFLCDQRTVFSLRRTRRPPFVAKGGENIGAGFAASGMFGSLSWLPARGAELVLGIPGALTTPSRAAADCPKPRFTKRLGLLLLLAPRGNIFDCCRGAIDTSYDVACLALCPPQRTVFASFWIKGGHFFCFFSRIKKRRSMIYAV